MPEQRVSHRLTIGLAVALAMCTLLLGGASAAWAQDGFLDLGISPRFPWTVTVGARGVPAELMISNTSTGVYADDVIRIDEITLTPSCGPRIGFSLSCPGDSVDPGVFVLNGPAKGRAGFGCAGRDFTITLVDTVSGRYLFTPVGGEVTLPAAGTSAGTCIIDFTVDVARVPAKDSDPDEPGLQTDQRSSLAVTVISPGSTLGHTAGAGETRETRVRRAAPQIVTAVSDASITLGQSFTDTATLTVPAGGPAPTGTVRFSVYGPDDATCTGPPIATSTVPVGAGAATSHPFTPTAPGTYRVIARYSGDANYPPVSGLCNDPNESVVVTAARSLPAVVNLSANFMLRDSLTTGPPTLSFTYRSRPQVPIMGDWDGDGTRTAGAYSGGVFYLNNQNDGSAPEITFAFGDPRGFPVVGDFNGDGSEDVAVYRSGLWQVRLSTDDTYTFTFGTGTWPATIPVVGDWDGDGSDGIGTYTYATAEWALRNGPTGNGGADVTFGFGTPNASYPVPGDWDADGDDTVGVKTGMTWSLNNRNDDSAAEVSFDYGTANDLPLTWKSGP